MFELVLLVVYNNGFLQQTKNGSNVKSLIALKFKNELYIRGRCKLFPFI